MKWIFGAIAIGLMLLFFGPLILKLHSEIAMVAVILIGVLMAVFDMVQSGRDERRSSSVARRAGADQNRNHP